jgi:hypothetical protein
LSESIESHPTHLDQKEVQAALKTPEGQRFISWSRLPIASVEARNGWHRVKMWDLRFRTRFRRANPFVLIVDLDEDLKPVRTTWSWTGFPKESASN